MVAFKCEALERALYSEGRHMAAKPPNLTLPPRAGHHLVSICRPPSSVIGPTVTVVTMIPIETVNVLSHTQYSGCARSINSPH